MKIFGLVLLILLPLLLLVPASSASAGAEHNKDIRNFDFTETVTNPCNGDTVEFSGVFQVVDQFTATGQGIVTLTSTTSFKGVAGTDLTTGAIIHWTEGAHSISVQLIGGELFVNTSTLMERWPTPGPDNDMVIRALFVNVSNANGIQEVDLSSFTTSCQ